jgi:hypothetical protein
VIVISIVLSSAIFGVVAIKFSELEVAYTNLKELTMLHNDVLEGGMWQCVAERCTEWAYGDDWITDNCRPYIDDRGDITDLNCSITVAGETYHAPLSIINISNVRSCREYVCLTEAYIKKSIEEVE